MLTNVLSLFDGISCGQLALHRSNIKYENYYASEIDQQAIKVTQTHFPNTIQLGDVCKVSSIDLPKIDLLIGGSPCQGFSFAGKQLNFNDSRSKLFFEFVRLLEECKPKYFLLENVKMKQEYIDIISSFLGVNPIRLNSNLVSAQNRDRLYWTNIGTIIPKDRNKFFNKFLFRQKHGYITSAIKFFKKYPTLTTNSPSTKYRIVVNLFLLANKTQKEIRTNNKITRCATPEECELLQTLPIGYTSILNKTKRFHVIGNCWTVDIVAHIFKGIKWNLKRRNTLKFKLFDSLAVRYRPKTLDAIIGNELTKRTIKGFFANRQLVKTWMLIGSSGSSKTTLSRIIANTVNCEDLNDNDEPCGKCASCKGDSDIIEINAAESRSIDMIRDLLELVKLQPSSVFRVIILDECQQLSPAAIQALLKPIEEPPPRTIWILCTTDTSKIPETIMGRCLKLYTNYPSPQEVEAKLLEISKIEYPDKYKRLKPYINKISLGIQQPREAIQLLETVAASLAKTGSNLEDIEPLLANLIKDSSPLASVSMKFVKGLLTGKMNLAFEAIDSLDKSRVSDFLINCWKYSQFTVNYILAKKEGKRAKSNYGLNTIKWEAVLEKLDLKGIKRPLKLCAAITDSLEKLRTGVVMEDMVLIRVINEYIK